MNDFRTWSSSQIVFDKRDHKNTTDGGTHGVLRPPQQGPPNIYWETSSHTSNHPRTCVDEALLFSHNFTSMDRSTVHHLIVLFEGRCHITAGCIVVYVDIHCLASSLIVYSKTLCREKYIFLLNILVLFPVEISKHSQIKIHLLKKLN